MTIAFIGLGNMGGGMAANQARAGRKVMAFDLSADALARAMAHGCDTAASDALADDAFVSATVMLSTAVRLVVLLTLTPVTFRPASCSAATVALAPLAITADWLAATERFV